MAEKAKQLKIDDIETPKDSAKEKALADALKTIEKAYGKGSIMKLGDANQEKIEVIPSGSIALDMALGVGGYPKGRIIEVFGPESSGKTTFALHAIAEAQKKEVMLPLLMLSTLLILHMQKLLALTLIT